MMRLGLTLTFRSSPLAKTDGLGAAWLKRVCDTQVASNCGSRRAETSSSSQLCRSGDRRTAAVGLAPAAADIIRKARAASAPTRGHRLDELNTISSSVRLRALD